MQQIKCWIFANTIDDYHAIVNRLFKLRVNKKSKRYYVSWNQCLTKDDTWIMAKLLQYKNETKNINKISSLLIWRTNYLFFCICGYISGKIH